jgi:hypothetical protein
LRQPALVLHLFELLPKGAQSVCSTNRKGGNDRLLTASSQRCRGSAVSRPRLNQLQPADLQTFIENLQKIEFCLVD